jgi:uncharacterized protein YjbI with pentapeptide repeats
MTNQEPWAILMQGLEVWNRWRKENPDVKVKFGNAMLIGANLRRFDLSKIYFREAELTDADLSGANLQGANLREADLIDTNLREADLTDADLSDATLWRANFRDAKLTRANLGGAQLKFADFRGADLSHCNFSNARLLRNNLVDIDLSEVDGLEDVIHAGPSTIGIDTVIRSSGKIPEIFLRGCGLRDIDIQYVKLSDPNLSNEEISRILYRIYDVRATQALQISPLFISYSHADGEFVDKVGNSLTEKGVRYWRDTHEMKAGRIEKQIDQAISQNRTVLLVLSENSMRSDWVEHEVRSARGLEKETGRDVLCPVALDDSWKSSRWPERLMEQVKEYNILDFSEWEDESKFGRTFGKLIDGLGLYYKG